MDISLELKGLPCLNKAYLLTYLLNVRLQNDLTYHIFVKSKWSDKNTCTNMNIMTMYIFCNLCKLYCREGQWVIGDL